MNAIVGPWQFGDDEHIIGDHGVGARNERGEWLVEWATAHRLTIVSTTIENCFDDQWTHENGGIKRQLDYCLIDAARAR